jgi:hypothetical protein
MNDNYHSDTKLWRVTLIVETGITLTIDPVAAGDEEDAVAVAARMAFAAGVTVLHITECDYEVVESEHDWSYFLSDSDRTH